MNDKQQILIAVQEEFHRWEALLASLSEAQRIAPEREGDWSVKDVLAHLKAWQELSTLRLEAGLHGREPIRPDWPEEFDLETESNVDETNAWIYAMHREQPWPSVYGSWREGFLRFIAAGEAIPEAVLLLKKRYDWTDGYSLADSLINSTKHHEEHREILLDWLGQQP